MSVGAAHVLYPEATDERFTAAVFLSVDPIGLVRNRRLGGNDALSLSHYVFRASRCGACITRCSLWSQSPLTRGCSRPIDAMTAELRWSAVW